jgi:hypothetical protein
LADNSGDLPGYPADEVCAKPHRQMTADELARYNLPEGTIIMATQAEIDRQQPIGLIEQMSPFQSEQDQINDYLAKHGLIPWTGAKQPTFAHNGQPVPHHLYNAPVPIPHAPDPAGTNLGSTQQYYNSQQQGQYNALQTQFGGSAGAQNQQYNALQTQFGGSAGAQQPPR